MLNYKIFGGGKNKTVIHKMIIGGVSFVKFALLKIRWNNRLKMSAINSLRGNQNVNIGKFGSVQIGRFLMTAGPVYLKTGEHGKIEIGRNVFLNHNFSATAIEEIKIEDNCNIGNNCVIVDHDHTQIGGKAEGKIFSAGPVVIKENVWLGANVTILKNVTIGEGAIVAAGAVVTHDVEPSTIVAGVPARKIGVVKA